MSAFAVGDVAYVARYHRTTEVTVPCPVCFGTKQVTLRLGNGDEVQLRCDYCRKGYDDPRGFVHEYQAVCKAERVVIEQVTTTETQFGQEREYRFNDRYIGDDGLLFATEAEALKRAEELRESDRIAYETRAEYIKKDTNKSYAWNAGYHMREAKKNRKQADYHERMAVICKAHVKTEAVR
jgi:hypothetical protein